MNNMVIYEMSDLRDVIKEVTKGVEDLRNFQFTKSDKAKIDKIARSVVSGGKVSVGNKISFISYFLGQCRLVCTFEMDAPMACNVTTSGLSSKMNIYYNPIRMAYRGGIQHDDMIFLDSFESVGNVLLHEAYHLMYNHLDTYDYYIKTGYMEQVNIGTDCQINQDPVIMADKVLMDYGISLDSVKRITGDDTLQPRQSSDYYFSALMKGSSNSNQQNPQSGGSDSQQVSECGQGGDSGQGQSDSQQGGASEQGNSSDPKDQAKKDARASHSVWYENPKDVPEDKVGDVADSTSTTQAITDGVEEAMKQGNFSADEIKSRGLVAGEIIDSIINGRNRKSKLPIKHFVQKGVGRIKRGSRKTYSRINRHQSNNVKVLRGKKDATVKNIHVYYDTSGSVSQSEIEWTFEEIAALAYRVKADLYATPFDSKVYPEATCKVDKFGNYNPTIKGFGGTSFQPVFDHLYETNKEALRNNDLVVIFTDGGGESHIETHGVKNIIWILVGQDRDVLSVKDPVGMLAYLEDDQNYQVHKMTNR